jgi:hypothetical protein
MPLPRPQAIARRLAQRSRAQRAQREEQRFETAVRADPQAPELLLSPHWDDAVLDCWNLLSDGRQLLVVNLFAGSPPPGRLTPWDAITGARDSAERTHERLAEDAVALARAGHEPVNLSFLDAQYRSGAGPDLGRLDAAVSEQVQAAAHVHVPAGLGGHADHRLARRYGQMLARRGLSVSLYADLPYCVAHGWPGWVDGREPDLHRDPDAYWMSFLEDVPEMPPLHSGRVSRLDDAAAAAKLDAMRCYQTQYPALDYGARGLLADPEIHRYEVSWTLAPSA